MILSLFISIHTGFLLVRVIWPGRSRWEPADWLRGPLGVLTGLGLSSIVAFLVQLADSTNRGLWILSDLFLWAAALIAYALLGRAAIAETPVRQTELWAPAKWVALAAVVTMVMAYALMALPRQTGDIDAWSIWNMRARFLFRGGTFATMADPLLQWIHPEFPYALSALVLRSWRWAAAESMAAPMSIAALFVASLTMAMYGAVRLVRTPSQGFVALVVLLGSAGFIGNGAVQYADFPLAAFLFGSIAAIAAAEHLASPRIAILAGLCAGFAAWTKFEGIFYAVALAGFALWRLKRAGLLFFAGAIPGCAMLAYFKMMIAPVTQASSADVLPLLTAVASKLFTFAFLGWVFTPFLVFAVYLYCVGLSKRKHVWIALAALFVSGCLAVLVRDDNFGDAAAIRLILHLWPVALFAMMVHANAPEELLPAADSPRVNKAVKLRK